MALKHIGRMKKNQRKVVVAYRTLPGDPLHAVVVTTENLEAGDHDAFMKLVESYAGQTADELADAMARTRLPDGRIMLSGFHTTGKMVKVATADVEMTPDTKTTISLDELNSIIAQQKGVALEDLAVKGTTQNVATVKDVAPSPDLTENLQAPSDGVLTDEQLAAKYRSDADRLYKEAKRLREQAEELAPTKKAKKSEQSA